LRASRVGSGLGSRHSQSPRRRALPPASTPLADPSRGPRLRIPHRPRRAFAPRSHLLRLPPQESVPLLLLLLRLPHHTAPSPLVTRASGKSASGKRRSHHHLLRRRRRLHRPRRTADQSCFRALCLLLWLLRRTWHLQLQQLTMTSLLGMGLVLRRRCWRRPLHRVLLWGLLHERWQRQRRDRRCCSNGKRSAP
jgi:hypothetical protein